MTSIDDKSYADSSSDDVELMEDIVELDDNESIEETDVFEDDVVELDDVQIDTDKFSLRRDSPSPQTDDIPLQPLPEASVVTPALVNPEPLSLRRNTIVPQTDDISFSSPPPEASEVAPALINPEPQTDVHRNTKYSMEPSSEIVEQQDSNAKIEGKFG